MWQTDFTCFRIIVRGWMFLSTVLDNVSRCITVRKLCNTMRAEEDETLSPFVRGIRSRGVPERALTASGFDRARVQHMPRLLGDNGSSYITADPADCDMPRQRRPDASPDPRRDQALIPEPQEPHPARKLLAARRSRKPDRDPHRALQSSALPRKSRKRDWGRRPFGRVGTMLTARMDRTPIHPKSTLAGLLDRAGHQQLYASDISTICAATKGAK